MMLARGSKKAPSVSASAAFNDTQRACHDAYFSPLVVGFRRRARFLSPAKENRGVQT